MKFNIDSHSKYRLMYHLAWIAKYRKRILQGLLKARLEKLFRECADINKWTIEELNIQEDLVLMLIGLKPSISVSKAVQYLKRRPSRIIRK